MALLPMFHVRTALVAALVVGCGACDASQALPPPADQAARFVRALNAKDTEAMAEVSGIPFRFRNQQWASAPDGTGFVLGNAEERVAADAVQLDPLLRELATNVSIAEPNPVADPPSRSDMLSEPLRGAPSVWSQLELVLFRRGEGDVEHIAIVGIEAASGKVLGLYVN
jgi:hypothetical protein